jgi:DNA mismatch repair protein MutL
MIAAGEVVERPASVVKELCENCIDAGAKSITVEIKKGGITYIRVTDDGCGIEKGEIATAFLRHATSKISKASDLDAIGTLGFRGEALASIAAVSRVEVFSKTANSKEGTCLTVEGGEVLDIADAGCPDGTTMIVRNLFFNTPARMKFLKSDSGETGYVTDVINKLVLSHPEIAFKYINNGKTMLSSNGDGKLINSIYTVFGKDYAKNMTEVCYEENDFKVTGFVGNSRLSRKDRRHQIFFVNTRNIQSKIMSAAVSEAYKSTVMTGHFPVCVLKAELDSKAVDVNVHPAKIEVRFADEKNVYNMVYWAVKNALTEKKFVPELEIKSTVGNKSAEGTAVKKAPSYDGSKQMDINLLRDYYVETPKKEEKVDTSMPFFVTPEETDNSRFKKKDENPLVMERKVIQDTSRIIEVKEEPKEEIKQNKIADVDFKLVGQVFGTYIIVQMDNEMLIIDQHAAHERLYYEELLEEFKANGVASQIMLLPVTMTLTATELNLAMENANFFTRLGFEVDVFGSESLIVRATPGMMEEQDIKDLVSDILSIVAYRKDNVTLEMYENALHRVACKRALKGNSVLNDTEMKALCEKVLSLGDGINTCPHGRPIMIKMSKYSVEKQLKRIV